MSKNLLARISPGEYAKKNRRIADFRLQIALACRRQGLKNLRP
jgi:hypothetical protein